MDWFTFNIKQGEEDSFDIQRDGQRTMLPSQEKKNRVFSNINVPSFW